MTDLGAFRELKALRSRCAVLVDGATWEQLLMVEDQFHNAETEAALTAEDLNPQADLSPELRGLLTSAPSDFDIDLPPEFYDR